MDGAVIWNEVNGKIIKEFNTLRGAKGSFTRTGLALKEDLVCSTRDYYLKTGWIVANQLVPVVNILTGNTEHIRRYQLGTCCDPSMELYHTM